MQGGKGTYYLSSDTFFHLYRIHLSMIFGRKKGKKKEELELKEEEHEVSLKTPIGGYSRKRRFGKKERQEPAEKTKSEQPVVEQKKPQVREGDFTIEPEHYEVLSLGELKRGTKLIIECRELEGKKFTYYVLDSLNMNRYRSEGSASKSISKGIDDDEHNDKVKISMTGQYYFVVTSKAWEYDRNVWYRIEM